MVQRKEARQHVHKEAEKCSEQLAEAEEKAERRYREDKARQRKLVEETKRMLALQLDQNRELSAAEQAVEAEDVRRAEAAWAAELDAQREREAVERARLQRLNEEIDAFNRCVGRVRGTCGMATLAGFGLFVLPGHACCLSSMGRRV